MKRGMLFLFAAAYLRAAGPTQADLDAALKNAEAAWGEHIEVRAIRLTNLGDCRGINDLAGWGDAVARTIDVNPSCVWDSELIRTVVAHEYGHLLMGTAAHSLDRHSVMYFKLAHGQHVTAEDREWMREALKRERPTILLARDK